MLSQDTAETDRQWSEKEITLLPLTAIGRGTSTACFEWRCAHLSDQRTRYAPCLGHETARAAHPGTARAAEPQRTAPSPSVAVVKLSATASVGPLVRRLIY